MKSRFEAVLAACAAHGVAVEINPNPWRLDLDWRCHQAALDLGCMMSINPDAHSTRELDLTHWGIETARKGGVPADRVLNAFTLPQSAPLSENGGVLHREPPRERDGATLCRPLHRLFRGLCRGGGARPHDGRL
jgi:hypothetical protein